MRRWSAYILIVLVLIALAGAFVPALAPASAFIPAALLFLLCGFYLWQTL
jgi:hypothetical protein